MSRSIDREDVVAVIPQFTFHNMLIIEVCGMLEEFLEELIPDPVSGFRQSLLRN